MSSKHAWANSEPAKPVLIQYGPSTGTPVYGLPEWFVRLCERVHRVLDDLVERAMEMESVQNKLRSCSQQKKKAVRAIIRKDLIEELLPLAYLVALRESAHEDHWRYTEQMLETVVSRGIIRALGREVALEKALEAIEHAFKSGALLGEKSPLAYVRRIVKDQGWKHLEKFGGTVPNQYDNAGESSLGVMDREHTTERVEDSRRYRTVPVQTAEPTPRREETGSVEEPNTGSVPAVEASEMLYARLMAEAKNDGERTYVYLLSIGHHNADAVRESGLSGGEAKAFRERARKKVSTS
jgi:hypothetical protein